MSVTSWKNEYGSIALLKKFRDLKTKPALDNATLPAIDASIKKWEGLKTANIKKHKLVRDTTLGEIFDPKTNSYYCIDCDTCHLCQVYWEHNYNECTGCPLFETGNNCFDDSSAFARYLDGSPASVMVTALKKARKYWIKEYSRKYPRRKPLK